MICFVFQDTLLFSATCARKTSRRAAQRRGRPSVEEAARHARAHDSSCNCPRATTRRGRGGLRLSGGERQRLSLARAILRTRPSSSWTRHRLCGPGNEVLPAGGVTACWRANRHVIGHRLRAPHRSGRHLRL
jgi:hypothetical protein